MDNKIKFKDNKIKFRDCFPIFEPTPFTRSGRPVLTMSQLSEIDFDCDKLPPSRNHGWDNSDHTVIPSSVLEEQFPEMDGFQVPTLFFWRNHSS